MAKRKKAARGAKSGGKGDVLVVASKVKNYIKGKKMNTSAEAIGALSAGVYCLIDRAIERTKGNGRKTVKAQDV